jgi:L-aspartate oxidase
MRPLMSLSLNPIRWNRWNWHRRRSLSTAWAEGPLILHDSFSSKHATDRLLVIGSGVAGSAAALIAAETYKIPVLQIFAGNLPTDCNSYWAQGGIIYRNYDPDSHDSAESLAADIHRAGAGLCDDGAVVKVATEGPDRVRQLLLSDLFCSVPFDRDAVTDQMSLCLEASHAAPRILYNADHTGRTITQCISEAVFRHPLIKQMPHTVVTDIIMAEKDCNSTVCVGVETMDRLTGQQDFVYATRGTVLASGGLAGIYQHSTNPPGFNALGSSVALAIRAGAAVQDLEYVQFHPTSLYIPNQARFLLTEALRGEGGILRDACGRAFARDYHVDGELAPRDIVARAVFDESQKSKDGSHNVFLDITHRDGEWLCRRFPSIQEHLAKHKLDLAKDLLPVTPAAHYTCGGIATDLMGRTNLTGLYAAGESARTGLHGGNRLASTSLLEGLVFGASVADFIGSPEGQAARESAVSSLSTMSMQRAKRRIALEPVYIENAAHRAMQLLRDLRCTMWDNVGVTRTSTGLETALEDLSYIQAEVADMYATCPTLETAAVRDAVCAGRAVTDAAMANRTSAGAHYLVADSENDSDDDMLAAAR